LVAANALDQALVAGKRGQFTQAQEILKKACKVIKHSQTANEGYCQG